MMNFAFFNFCFSGFWTSVLTGWMLLAEKLAFPAWTPWWESPVRGVGTRGSRLAHWKFGKLMTADELTGGADSESVRGLFLSGRGKPSGCVWQCVIPFLLLWQAPDCFCHLHLSHKGLMGRWTWQEGGTPICPMSDFPLALQTLVNHCQGEMRATVQLECAVFISESE